MPKTLLLLTFDVAVFVLAVLVCGRFELSLWPFWSDLWPFRSWPFSFVAVLDVIHEYLAMVHY